MDSLQQRTKNCGDHKWGSAWHAGQSKVRTYIAGTTPLFSIHPYQPSRVPSLVCVGVCLCCVYCVCVVCTVCALCVLCVCVVCVGQTVHGTYVRTSCTVPPHTCMSRSYTAHSATSFTHQIQPTIYTSYCMLRMYVQ